MSTCIYGEIKPNTEIYKWLGFKDSSTTIMDSIEKLISQLPNNCPQKGALRLAIQNTSANTIRGFPIKKVNDWDRLKIHAAKELFFADPVKYESKFRSVRISLKPNSYRTYLKHMYEIESTDNIACQLCHGEFLNFEGPQLLEQLPKEINPLHLCLCQNCTREYQIIRSNSKKMEEITDSIKQLNQNDISSAEEHVDIQIDQNKTLWFTQRHIAEIQEILNLIE